MRVMQAMVYGEAFVLPLSLSFPLFLFEVSILISYCFLLFLGSS